MKTPFTDGRSNRRRMTAAASWVGTPAIAEMADGLHFVARPVIRWSMAVSGLGGGGSARRGADRGRTGEVHRFAFQSNPLSWKLTEPVGVTIRWSSSVTSMVFSASRRRSVMAMSARDGSGEPPGWLWTAMTALA